MTSASDRLRCDRLHLSGAGMNAHTPGPWEVFETPFAIGVMGGKGADVAWTRHDDKGMVDTRRSREEDLANARLIAAAPDLLEALKGLYSYGCPACGGDCSSANPPVIGCPTQMARAAIAKAEGRA